MTYLYKSSCSDFEYGALPDVFTVKVSGGSYQNVLM